MEVNDIVAFRREDISLLLVSPEGRTRAAGIAKDVYAEFEMLPVLTSSHGTSRIIYGRVIEVISPVTQQGPPLLAISTFKRFTDVVCIALLSDLGGTQPLIIANYAWGGLITLSNLDTTDISRLQDLESEYFPVATTTPVAAPAAPVKTPIQKLEELLDAVFPNQYDIQANGILIHFPKFEITNGYNVHTIEDLFVKIPTNSQHTRITGSLLGLRASLSVLEVTTGYRHSHLPSGHNGFQNFCLGNTVNNDLMIDLIDSAIDYDKLLVFLYQLDGYVRWESKDGVPYISIDSIKKQAGRSTNGAGILPPPINDLSICHIDAQRVLENLTPNDLTVVDNVDGTTCLLVKTYGETAEKLHRLLSSTTNSMRYNYDPETKMYIDPSNDLSNNPTIRNFLGSSPLEFRGQTITRRLTNATTAQVQYRAIRIPPPSFYQGVIILVNSFLNTK